MKSLEELMAEYLPEENSGSGQPAPQENPTPTIEPPIGQPNPISGTSPGANDPISAPVAPVQEPLPMPTASKSKKKENAGKKKTTPTVIHGGGAQMQTEPQDDTDALLRSYQQQTPQSAQVPVPTAMPQARDEMDALLHEYNSQLPDSPAPGSGDDGLFVSTGSEAGRTRTHRGSLASKLPPYWGVDAVCIALTALLVYSMATNWDQWLYNAAMLIIEFMDVGFVFIFLAAAVLVIYITIRMRRRRYR